MALYPQYTGTLCVSAVMATRPRHVQQARSEPPPAGLPAATVLTVPARRLARRARWLVWPARRATAAPNPTPRQHAPPASTHCLGR